MRKEYRLSRTKWRVTVWWGSTRYDAEDIIDDLINAGAKGRDLRELSNAAWNAQENEGMTYVNAQTMRAVMVIGKASSKSEYANSVSHEICHLAVMLADAMDIDLRSESMAYLMGDIAQMLWHDSHTLTCPACAHQHGN